MENVFLLTAEKGELQPHPTAPKLGKFFSANERKFQDDLRRYGSLIVCEELIQVLDSFREEVGEVVTVTSFNRDDKKQAELNDNPAYKAATYSPHVVKLAADITTASLIALATEPRLRKVLITIMTNYYVPTLKRVAKELGIRIRIGYKQYLDNGQQFIHLDVCPEYFGKGHIWYDRPHPSPWGQEITW